jgi:hypothetical protein
VKRDTEFGELDWNSATLSADRGTDLKPISVDPFQKAKENALGASRRKIQRMGNE